MQKGLHLVCFLASVITDKRRLEFFRMLLDSVRKQAMPLNGGFLVSIYLDPELEPDVKSLFRNLNCPVKLLIQKRPKKQFVQIAEMYSCWEKAFPCPPDREPFFLFSDDDDLWSEHRTEAYFRIWDGACKSNFPLDKVTSICAREHTKHNDRLCEAHKDGSDVNAMIACGCVAFTEEIYPEYHEYAVRPFVVGEFLNTHDRLVRHNRFADMQFRSFVAGYSGYNTLIIQTPVWLYFYRKCDRTYICATNPVKQTRQLYFPEDIKEITALVEYIAEISECPAMGPDRAAESLKNLMAATTRTEAEAFFLGALVLKVKSDRAKLK